MYNGGSGGGKPMNRPASARAPLQMMTLPCINGPTVHTDMMCATMHAACLQMYCPRSMVASCRPPRARALRCGAGYNNIQYAVWYLTPVARNCHNTVLAQGAHEYRVP